MNFNWQPLSDRLNKKLPGVEAHKFIAHKLRHYSPPPPATVMKAGVLLLIYPNHEGKLSILLIQRTQHEKDKHKGQISFPGGKKEKEDIDMRQTALREAQEEVNLQPSNLTVIGALSEVYIPISNFLVFPFIAYSDTYPQLKKCDDEVERIIEVELDQLFTKDVVKQKNIAVSQQMILKNVPYFDLNGEVVWGATAMILHEFRLLLSDTFPENYPIFATH